MLKSVVNGPPPVVLAPMSGVSDLPFRRLAHRLGASLVVSEMVAGEELVKSRADVLRRAEGRDLTPFVIQLAGREEKWMAEGRAHRRSQGRRRHRHQHGLPGKGSDRQAFGLGVDAQSRPRAGLDPFRRKRRQHTRDAEDAARLGRPNTKRARTRAPRRGRGRAAHYRPRPHALPVLHRHSRLERCSPGRRSDVAARSRQWRHPFDRRRAERHRGVRGSRRHGRPRCLRRALDAGPDRDVSFNRPRSRRSEPRRPA